MRQTVIFSYLLLVVSLGLSLCQSIQAESFRSSASGAISVSAHVANRTGLSRLDASNNSLKEIILKAANLRSDESSKYYILRLAPAGIASVSIEYQNKQIQIFHNKQILDDRGIVLGDASSGLTALVNLNQYLPQKPFGEKPVLVRIIYPFQ